MSEEKKLPRLGKKKTKFPPYVRIVRYGNGGLGCALRRIKGPISAISATYYRDAGQWEIKAKMRDGKLISIPYKEHPQLSEVELVEISEILWREDNEGYL